MRRSVIGLTFTAAQKGHQPFLFLFCFFLIFVFFLFNCVFLTFVFVFVFLFCFCNFCLSFCFAFRFNFCFCFAFFAFKKETKTKTLNKSKNKNKNKNKNGQNKINECRPSCFTCSWELYNPWRESSKYGMFTTKGVFVLCATHVWGTEKQILRTKTNAHVLPQWPK